jgi:tetratricopeptide (TPR) repeat protein/TRAP-type uncharacterized transport system substrate-binding protein
MRLKFNQRERIGRTTSAAKKTLYDFLDVHPGADAQTLKRAFRKTIKEHHPDLHRDDPAASQRTKVLIAAHKLLSDPQQRAAYDQYLAQLHEPPPRSEWQRKIIYGASTAVCLSFALLSAWNLSVASTLIDELMPMTQGRPIVKAAAWGLSPNDSIITETKVVTAASFAGASPGERPLSAGDDTFRISESDDLERVIADLNRVVQREADNARAYRDRANAWARKGDMDRAMADYEQAIRIDPNDPAIFHERALTWQRKGEFDKAIIDFDRAVRMSFTDPELYCDRGLAWFEKGRLDRALADFNKALKINPSLATAYLRRADVFERKGDQERARADREQANRLGVAGKSITSSSTPSKIVETPAKAGVSTPSSSRTTFDQVVAATAVAERVTAATSVAILIARPEIKSVSDLAGKSIVIDRAQSGSSSGIRTAIANAGAAEVQLTESQTQGLDRVISAEATAAVLTLASQEAAEGFPEISGFTILRVPIAQAMPLARVLDPQPATNARTSTSDVAATAIANVRPMDAATDNSAITQELVKAATTVAERMTAALTPSQSSEQRMNQTGRSQRSEIDDPEKATAVRSVHPDPRIAILMARSPLKSIADLAGQEIAIDEKHSILDGNIQAAIAAAGAAQVQMSEGQKKAINRLIRAEVPAAVLAVVSPEAAEAFPEIPGFKIFRIPLPPVALDNDDSSNH